MSGQAKVSCETYLILECIDPTEFAALVDEAKEGLKIILSCGTVKTTQGSPIHNMLEAIFPSGVTRTALDELFSYTPPGP